MTDKKLQSAPAAGDPISFPSGDYNDGYYDGLQTAATIIAKNYLNPIKYSWITKLLPQQEMLEAIIRDLETEAVEYDH